MRTIESEPIRRLTLCRFNAIVALDGNFSQRRKGKEKHCDVSIIHTHTQILSTEEVNRMAIEVDRARDLPTSIRDQPKDECARTFIAAQGHIAKANGQRFDETGLMVMVCRHDHPLFLASITTPGERQHYPLALLKRFFMHIPSTWHIGIMYDVGCQLKKSMERVCPRLTALAIFLMCSSTTSFLTFYPGWDSQLGYSMHMDTSGPARLSSTLANAVVLVVPMGRGVSDYGIKIFHSLAQCGMLECVLHYHLFILC